MKRVLTISALIISLSSCGSSSSPSTKSTVDSSGSATAVETVAVGALETQAPSAIETVIETTPVPEVKPIEGAVTVSFDAPRGEPRPIHETDQAIDSPTKVLGLKVTNMTYRGVVCGFTFKGEAPASPVAIRMHGKTPSGAFDSAKLEVSWTALDAGSVTSGEGSNGGWNFLSEAHRDRGGNGWVVSLGGVTATDGNGDKSVTPTDAACEIESAAGFDPKNGPVGYWAGYAAV